MHTLIALADLQGNIHASITVRKMNAHAYLNTKCTHAHTHPGKQTNPTYTQMHVHTLTFTHINTQL